MQFQADIPSFLISILFALSPFLIVFFFYLIVRLWKKGSFFERIFLRLTISYAVFMIFYVFIPATINLINPPENQYLLTSPLIDLDSSGVLTVGYWNSSLNSFLRFWLQTIINSFLTFVFYPVTLLPVIFIFGAFISFFLVLYQLKKLNKKENLGKSLSILQFGYEDNPIGLIYEKLREPNFENAWDLFKILIAVLPISLYLLMTLLKVTGNQENPNILQGTSLGWFLEIFFVYLASAMFSVHLLYSSKLSFKGDYMGLKLRNAMVQSLSTVGTLMSSIAIVLFVIDFSRQFFVVIYFISYFIMVTIFFVLFLDLFEPISIFMLTKMVEYAKNYTSQTFEQEKPKIKVEEVASDSVEIFVPKINFDELSGPEVQPEEKIEEAAKVEVTTVESTELEIDSSTDTKKLKQIVLKDSSVSILKIAFIVVFLGIFMKTITFFFNNNSHIDSSSSQTILLVSFFLYLSIPVLISIFLFARNHFKVTIIAILSHSIITMVDWTLRFAMVNWSGSEKFESLYYQSSYYFLEFYLVIILLALTLLIMRRYNWNSFSNIGILFGTGLVMSLTWMFMFSNEINIVVPFLNQPLLHGFEIGLSTRLTPADTFHTIVDTFSQQGESWVTFVFINVKVNSTGLSLIIPFLSSVEVNLVPFLHLFSLFFRFIQPLSAIILFGLLFFLYAPEFLSVAYKDGEKVEKIVYSERLVPLTLQEVSKNPYNYAVSRNFGLGDENEIKGGFTVTQIEESIYQLGIGAHIIQFIGEAPITFADLQEESLLSLEEILGFFNEISKINLSKAKPFLTLSKEFGFNYEEATLDSLHVMMVDGRPVFAHNFSDKSAVDPGLISGLFTAITSFAKETVKSEQLLRTIDHGDVVLMIEYGRFVFSAIFADKNSVELRNKLAQFVEEFEQKHEEDLANWLGDTSPFADDWMLVNQLFDVE